MSAITAVLEKMDTQLEAWDAASDYRAVFLRAYRAITQRLDEAIDREEFEDNRWMERLDIIFADEYFNALAAHEAEQAHLPECWRLIFDAALQKKTSVLQDLLLGMTAHISHDLPIAMSKAGLGGDDRELHHRDHDHLNEILAEMIDSVQHDIVKHYSTLLHFFDRWIGHTDEAITAAGIRMMRAEAWRVAVELTDAPDQQASEALLRTLDDDVSARARVILAPTQQLGRLVRWFRWIDRAVAGFIHR